MKRAQQALAGLLPAIVFFILPLLLYWQVTIGPDTMIPADNLYQWQPWRTYIDKTGTQIPDNSLLSDMVLQNYAWKKYIRDTVLSGDIPLWNPHLFAGAPFLATGQNAAYYPFSLLFFVLPLTKAYGWYTVSQLWLAGMLTYVFGRVLKLRRASSILAGIVFQGCGFMLVSAAVFPMIIGAAAWLPLLLACLEMIVRTTTDKQGAGRTLPWVALGGLGLGIQILAGHIEITYYSLIVMAFYAAWRLISFMIAGRWSWAQKRSVAQFLRPPAWLLATVGLGLMLGAIQFVPFYEVGATNFREGSATLEEVRGWAFPPRRILTVALPNFYGNPSHHTYTDAFTGQTIAFNSNANGQLNPHGAYTSNWGIKNYVEGGIYLGILPLFLAAIGLIVHLPKAAGRRSEILFFATLSFLSIAFIFGTPLYAVLYYGFPGINQLHSPFRWVFPLSICVAILAGYGMDFLATSRHDFKQDLVNAPTKWSRWTSDSRWRPAMQPLILWGPPGIITAVAGAAFWGGVILLATLFASRSFFDTVQPIIEPIFLDLAQASDAFRDVRAFYSYQFTNTLHLSLMLITAGVVFRVSRCPIYLPGLNAKHPIWMTLAALILILDIFVIGRGFNAQVDPKLLNFKSEMVSWLESQTPLHEWRLTSFDNKGSKPFNANAGWPIGLHDVRGYDSIIAKQYTTYMAAIEPQNELQFNRIQPLGNWESINSPLVDLLGIRYIITQETLELPKLQLAWEGEGVRIYENLDAMPRSYTLPQASTFVAQDNDVFAAVAEVDPRNVVIFTAEDLADASLQFNAVVGQPQPSPIGPASITSYTNREVWVDTEVTESSWLILNDSYFSGWRAYARPLGADDNAESELQIVRVNGNFRAVELQPGAWTVRYRYSPITFLLGGLTSVMSLIIIFFAFVVWGWRRYYRPDQELTNTRSIAKNSMAPMALNLFNRGIDFLFAAFYLRLLGPADAGAYATAIAIAGLYEILSNFGLNAYLIREISQEKQKASSYLLNTTLLRLGTGTVASAPILLYLWSSGYRPDTTTAVLFLMVGMVISGMASGLTGLFYAYEEAEIPAAVTTVTTILKVGFGVGVLLAGFGFVGLAAVSIIVNLFTLTILVISVRRRYPLNGPWNVDFGLQRKMIVQSYPLMINHFLATVYWQVDVLLLSQINGDEVVGWYNSAYKYVNALNVIPSFFTFALFPIIARQVQTSVADARRTFRMSAKLLTLVSLPLAAIVTLMAPILIGLLGGDAFLPHGYIALQAVIWSIPFGWLNSVTNYVLISLGQERVQTRAFVLGVGFNIIGNIILLPRFSYVGAALTTIASEIILLALFNYYLVQKMPSVEWSKLLWRPVVVTIGMIAIMLAVAQFNIWLALIAGLIAYPAGLWIGRVFGPEEQRILESILPASIAQRLNFSTKA